MLEKSSESDLSATAAASQPPLDVQAAIAEVRAFIDPLLEEAVDRREPRNGFASPSATHFSLQANA